LSDRYEGAVFEIVASMRYFCEKFQHSCKPNPLYDFYIPDVAVFCVFSYMSWIQLKFCIKESNYDKLQTLALHLSSDKQFCSQRSRKGTAVGCVYDFVCV